MYLSSGMQTYSTITLSEPHAYAADLLRLKLGIYGRAVKHIDINFHWANKKPVGSLMREQAKDFNESLKNLPRVKFDRRNRRIEVDVVSSRFFEEQKDKRPSKNELKYGNAEYLEALELIKEKVKFDGESFDIDQLTREATGILDEGIPNAAERRKVEDLENEWSYVPIANTSPFEFLVAGKDSGAPKLL